MTIGRMARRGALAAGLVAVTAAGAAAQKAQWTDVVYVPGFWSGGRIAARAESLALVMRVDYFSAPPKWRAEIRRTTDGRTMGAATILVGNGATALVVTQVGTTPLEQHALGRDSLVRAAVVFDAGGRRKGAASGRIAERGAGGATLRVVYRRSVSNPNFDTAMLEPGARAGSRTLLASGLQSVGDQRSASVVATAGARGVDRVKTPGGDVPVRPDTVAIARMERVNVGSVALEEFMRAGGLGPYAADSTGRHP